MATLPKCTRCGTERSPGAQGNLCAECIAVTAFEEGTPGYSNPKARPADGDKTIIAETQPRLPAPASQTAALRFGDYELLEELARGGMGVVWKARQVSLNRTVALKMILAGVFASTEDIKRFRTEAEAVATLDHPNIVPIYDVGEHENRHFFAMKLIEGGNLAFRMEQLGIAGIASPGRTTRPEGRSRQEWAARTMLKVARAVHHAHQRGVLHRDLKPANVLLDTQGEPHVTDFGLAKLVNTNSGVTQTEAVMGTPGYMAPEQAAGKARQLTTAADVYSLGAIFYHLLAGQPPFTGHSPIEIMRKVIDVEPEPPRALNLSVDRDLETICMRCIEKDPTHRYGSAEAMADELDRWLRQEPILARPSTFRERAVKWARRRPAIAALSGALVILGVAGVLTITSQLRRTRDLLDRSDKSLYFNRLARIERELPDGNREMAEQLLDECPVKYRDWEWRYLEKLCRSDHVTYTLPGIVRNPSFSDDGAKIVGLEAKDANSDSRWWVPDMNTLRLWEAATGRTVFSSTLKSSLSSKSGFVSVCVSPDSTRIAATYVTSELLAGMGGSQPYSHWVLVADTTTGKDLARFRCPINAGRISFTHDGQRLIMGDYNYRSSWIVTSATNGDVLLKSTGGSGRVTTNKSLICVPGSENSQIFDATTAKPQVTLKGKSGMPHRTKFNESGSLVTAAIFDDPSRSFFARTTIWNIQTGDIVLGPISGDIVEAIVFTLDGRRFALPTSSGTNAVSSHFARQYDVWNAASRKLVATARVPGTNRYFINSWNHTFSPDGRVLFLASQFEGAPSQRDPAFDAFDAETGRHLYRLPTGRLGFTRDGDQTVNTRSADGVIDFAETATGKPVRSIRTRAREGLLFTSQSKDGSKLLQGRAESDGVTTVKLWNIDPAPPRPRELTGHTDRITGLVFRPDGLTLASSSADGSIRLWNTVARRESGRLNVSTGAVNWVTFSDDGRKLASAEGNGSVRLWDVATWKTLIHFTNHSGPVLKVGFSPDGETAASVTAEKLLVWTTRNRVVLQDINWRGTLYAFFSFHPSLDSVWAVRASGVGPASPMRGWDPFTGRERNMGASPQLGAINSLALDATASRMAFGGNDYNVKVMAIPSGSSAALSGIFGRKKIAGTSMQMSGHQAPVTAVAFNPNGRRLASGSTDGTIKIWDLQLGLEALTLHGHTNTVTALVFSPDGERLFSGGADGRIDVWDATPGR
jgi:serine/threonine protein kinase/WD40 repeat protein